MASSEATVPLRSSELARLARLYDLEQYLFEVVAARFQDQHTLGPDDSFVIVVWKSKRAKAKVKRGSGNRAGQSACFHARRGP